MLLSVLFVSLSTILQRIILRENRSSPIAFSILFQLVVAGMVGLFGFLFTDMSLPNLIPMSPRLILLAVLYALASIFSFKALKETEASKYSILFTSRTIVAVVCSSIFLQQNLGLRQGVGALLILVSAVLVTIHQERFKLERGDIYTLIAAALAGIAVVNDKILVSSLPVYPFVTLAFLLPALLIVLARPKEVVHIKYFLGKRTLLKTLFFCSFFAAGAITYYTALQRTTNLPQATTINTTSVILTALLSIIFLKETSFLKRKLLGALLSFIGLILVS